MTKDKLKLRVCRDCAQVYRAYIVHCPYCAPAVRPPDEPLITTIRCLIVTGYGFQDSKPYILTRTQEDSHLAHYGVLTSTLAGATGTTNAKLLPRLRSLEKKGVLLCARHPGYTSCWWPVGYLAELKAQEGVA